jgi:nucleotide-binding universal stress UspA family protein
MRSVVSVEEELPVVVGVDDVPDGLHVIDVAAAEAAYRGVPLEIVHAWPGRPAGPARQRYVRPDPADGHHLLELAVRRAGLAMPGLRVSTVLADDSAAEALTVRTRQACLLVLGHRDEPGIGHGWGMTAAYVAHHSACPLLVCLGPSPGNGPVAVATSGRYTATVGSAFDAAVRAGCPLVAVHVRTPDETGADQQRSTMALARWSEVWPEVAVEQLVISEPEIAYTLERASRRSRLLVAGRGRKGWITELLYSVNRFSTAGRRMCPVLLIPPGWPVTAAARAASATTRS